MEAGRGVEMCAFTENTPWLLFVLLYLPPLSYLLWHFRDKAFWRRLFRHMLWIDPYLALLREYPWFYPTLLVGLVLIVSVGKVCSP